MDQNILDYIKSQRVGVIAIEMMDGSPHAATVHFAHVENPLTFIFETDRQYRKSEALFGRDKSRASFVIGFQEGTDLERAKTFQCDGFVKLVSDNKENMKASYLQKFPEKEAKSRGLNVVFFTFTLTWWRFTEWGTPEGKKIVTSSDK